MNEQLTILAPAKLNVALAIGHVHRPPNEAPPLHPICSWMVTVDLCDELLITRLAPGRLSRYAVLWHEEAKRRSDINWSITKDLAVRAHLALEKHVGRPLPVQVKLEKRIPVGGGLGGGSSDAAAMLRGLNALFDLGLSIDELAALGATLGSDVAFLVHCGSAIVEGVGEKIERHEGVPELHAVVAFPEVVCPTGRVYQLFDELVSTEHELRVDAVRALPSRARSLLPEGVFNDLATAAVAAAPSLRDDIDRLTELAERQAHVSGSGSTLFVLCDDAIHASALATTVESRLGLPAAAVQTQAAPAPELLRTSELPVPGKS